VNAEKTIDLQKRELDKYWRELSYDRKVNDKRKVIKLEKKINGIKDAAVNLVDELRVLKSTYAGVKAKVATMKRISKTAANALNNAVTEVTRAKGSLEQANVARALADEKVQKREQELTDQVDQNAELTPEDRSADLSDLMGSDAKLQRARSEQLTSHNHHQLCTQELLGAEKVLKGAQEQQDSMDKQTIVILTKLKNIEGEKTQKTNRLKSLIGKAKDVANVVRKEEELMTPPSSVLAPPSMHHQLSWDQKADEANANAAAARLASMIKLGHGPPTEI
jgi:chromosome segregation ATPase